MYILKKHKWNNDKPYEWGLETLKGNTFFFENLETRNSFFVHRSLTPYYRLSQGEGERCVSKETPKSELDLDFGFSPK